MDRIWEHLAANTCFSILENPPLGLKMQKRGLILEVQRLFIGTSPNRLFSLTSIKKILLFRLENQCASERKGKDNIYSRYSMLQVLFCIYTTDGDLLNSALLI